MDREELFDILRDQNYWFKSLEKNYTSRPIYLRPELIQSKAILAIKGPRRSGKTILLKLIMEYLISKNIQMEQILLINLEDYRLYNHLSNDLLEKSIDVYRERINPTEKYYILIDEIQNIKGFESFLRTKYDTVDNSKFIITGSNAKLLSKELGTLLTGRIVTMEVLPFSFVEFLEYKCFNLEDMTYYSLEKNTHKLINLFDQYLTDGAIPEFFADPALKYRLQEYFENVLFRDLVERYNIRNSTMLKSLGIYLATNVSNLISVNRIANIFNASLNTIQEYLSYLSEAYLFFYLKGYNYSLNARSTSRSKVYCVDTGLANRINSGLSKNDGLMLENLVYLELRRSGAEVYYHREDGECDFIVKEGMVVTLAIQVTLSMENEKTKKREIAGLKNTMDKFQIKRGIILTRNEYGAYDNNVLIRPVWFWLINKDG